MKKLTSVLVTGCGGDIGTGVGRIIKGLGMVGTLVGADVSTDNAGKFVFDACEILPPASSPKYLTQLEQLVKKYNAELVVPAADAEIRFFSESNFAGDISGAAVVMANSEALRVGADKLQTYEFLKSNALPYPWTCIVGEHTPLALPCIIKSRYGRGSKGVELVEADHVAYLTKKRPADIWQEYLTPDDEEYTCGIYGCANGDIRTIIFKRRLGGGLTVAGEVVENKDIDDVLRRVAQGLGLRGSINAQLRLTQKGAVIFEINPRFSSTVVFRHKLGFKDVLWAIEEKTGNAPSPYTPPRVGTKFYKGYTEYINPSFEAGSGTVSKSRGPHTLTLRPAAMGDAEVLFQWRNDETAWREFRNARPVVWEEHKRWLTKTLNGEFPGRIIMIAEYAGEKIGVVRSDERENGLSEVSYQVAPEWRGQGLGKRMALEFVKTHLSGHTLMAQIKKGNVASESVARALGLKPFKEETSDNPDDRRALVEWR